MTFLISGKPHRFGCWFVAGLILCFAGDRAHAQGVTAQGASWNCIGSGCSGFSLSGMMVNVTAPSNPYLTSGTSGISDSMAVAAENPSVSSEAPTETVASSDAPEAERPGTCDLDFPVAQGTRGLWTVHHDVLKSCLRQAQAAGSSSNSSYASTSEGHVATTRDRIEREYNAERESCPAGANRFDALMSYFKEWTSGWSVDRKICAAQCVTNRLVRSDASTIDSARRGVIFAQETGAAACMGFSGTVAMLLTAAGVQRDIQAGSLNGSLHAWVSVYVPSLSSWRFLEPQNQAWRDGQSSCTTMPTF
jgi:hypothetical protein